MKSGEKNAVEVDFEGHDEKNGGNSGEPLKWLEFVLKANSWMKQAVNKACIDKEPTTY